MHEKTLISLACMEAGFSGVVYDIQGGYGIMNTLKSLGIISGSKITRISPVTIQGPITVDLDNVQIAIGFGIASRIMVKVEEKVCDH